ncbi:MAG: RIP metalloprotease RseP [Pseudomonadota bacterium]
MQADFIIYILAFLGVLAILVTFHEFGHYIVARWSGVQVVKFSVGFGRPIWSYTDKRGTEFAVAAIPLGGFVRMLDDRDPSQTEQALPGYVPYMDLHPAWRIAIALGGPVANFILAIMVYWLLQVAGVMNVAPMVGVPAPDSVIARAGWQSPAQIMAVDGAEVGGWQDVGLALTDRLGETGNIAFSLRDVQSGRMRQVDVPILNWHEGVGEPDILGSLGIDQAVLPLIGGVQPETPAARAGLQTNDWIQAVDDRPVLSWSDWVNEIEASADKRITLLLYRDGQLRNIDVTPAAAQRADGSTKGSLGVYPPVIEMRKGPLEAIPGAFVDTWEKTLMTLGIVKKMFTGQVSVKNLSGPISIAQVAGDSAKYSWRSFVTILGFLSISLGVLNLLPIPILDGGQVVYNSVEWAMGKPVPERIQILGVQVGVLLVGTMLIFATYNDLLRLFA